MKQKKRAMSVLYSNLKESKLLSNSLDVVKKQGSLNEEVLHENTKRKESFAVLKRKTSGLELIKPRIKRANSLPEQLISIFEEGEGEESFVEVSPILTKKRAPLRVRRSPRLEQKKKGKKVYSNPFQALTDTESESESEVEDQKQWEVLPTTLEEKGEEEEFGWSRVTKKVQKQKVKPAKKEDKKDEVKETEAGFADLHAMEEEVNYGRQWGKNSKSRNTRQVRERQVKINRRNAQRRGR
eukprot:snap_masked-scaffold_6-processed-gene-2.35-mRNA-1 protein AED:1.00 eAED:1.00 QI:0/-1/0/0/-1/1/1/0/239